MVLPEGFVNDELCGAQKKYCPMTTFEQRSFFLIYNMKIIISMIDNVIIKQYYDRMIR